MIFLKFSINFQKYWVFLWEKILPRIFLFFFLVLPTQNLTNYFNWYFFVQILNFWYWIDDTGDYRQRVIMLCLSYVTQFHPKFIKVITEIMTFHKAGVTACPELLLVIKLSISACMNVQAYNKHTLTAIQLLIKS